MKFTKLHTLATVALFSLLFASGIFGGTLANKFVVWDDNKNIYENPYFNPPSIANTAELWVKPYNGLYIPVTNSIYSLLASFGENPKAAESESRFEPSRNWSRSL